MYEGNKGFAFLSTDRLVDTLRRYKRLRAAARDDATREYAKTCISEIHDELGRRNGSGSAVAA